jgi:DNA-binding LacI/PurR family transcriptional regulator
LTTIREFPEQLGRKMVELLINRILDPNQERQQVILPTEIVKRDSCRPILPTEDVTAALRLQNTMS